MHIMFIVIIIIIIIIIIVVMIIHIINIIIIVIIVGALRCCMPPPSPPSSLSDNGCMHNMFMYLYVCYALAGIRYVCLIAFAITLQIAYSVSDSLVSDSVLSYCTAL